MCAVWLVFICCVRQHVVCTHEQRLTACIQDLSRNAIAPIPLVKMGFKLADFACRYMQLPQAARLAAFRKAALVRLADATQDALLSVESSRQALMQAAQQANRIAMSQHIRQQLKVLQDVLFAIQQSALAAVQ